MTDYFLKDKPPTKTMRVQIWSKKRLSEEKQVSQVHIGILDLPHVRKRRIFRPKNWCLSSLWSSRSDFYAQRTWFDDKIRVIITTAWKYIKFGVHCIGSNEEQGKNTMKFLWTRANPSESTEERKNNLLKLWNSGEAMRVTGTVRVRHRPELR